MFVQGKALALGFSGHGLHTHGHTFGTGKKTQHFLKTQKLGGRKAGEQLRTLRAHGICQQGQLRAALLQGVLPHSQTQLQGAFGGQQIRTMGA